MRIFISVSLIIVFCAFSLPCHTGERTLYESRGFFPGKCYRHLAIRNCPGNDLNSCSIELFPDRTSALFFFEKKTSIMDKKIVSDYGVFDFFYSKNIDGIPFVRIIKVERILLAKWKQNQETPPVAREIPCL